MGIKEDIEILNKFKNDLSTQYYNGIDNEHILLTFTTETTKSVIDCIGNVINAINKIENIVEE